MALVSVWTFSTASCTWQFGLVLLPEECVRGFFWRRLLEGFRIRLLLARQWVHVYVSLLRLLGSGNFAPARGDPTGAVLGQGFHDFYACPVDKSSRSKMNVSFTFRGGDEALEKKFSVEAQWVKFFTLAGHRSVDVCPASLYNGLPLEGVEALSSFMKFFLMLVFAGDDTSRAAC